MHPETSRNDNPFHAGEQAVHERLGIRERMVDVGQRVIRTAMPEQHQRFFRANAVHAGRFGRCDR
jgi:predicted pyridoxine 5'-phosphate oxidase superfamily flavin-nucleotide-binding protein